MTGIGASNLSLHHPLFDPTRELNTRRIVLVTGVYSCSSISMATHRDAQSWETWTMHRPRGKIRLA
jgi:hypothetical protein